MYSRIACDASTPRPSGWASRWQFFFRGFSLLAGRTGWHFRLYFFSCFVNLCISRFEYLIFLVSRIVGGSNPWPSGLASRWHFFARGFLLLAALSRFVFIFGLLICAYREVYRDF